MAANPSTSGPRSGDISSFAVVESMTRIKLPPLTVRVWRAEPELASGYDNLDLHELAWKAFMDCHGNPAPIAAVLAEAPRVNAVEVVDERGDGCVVYKDWP